MDSMASISFFLVILLGYFHHSTGQMGLPDIVAKLRHIDKLQKSGTLQELSSASADVTPLQIMAGGLLPKTMTLEEDADFHNTQTTMRRPPTDPGKYPISSRCLNHSDLYIRELLKGSPWALEMLDASAKPPSGILQGALWWPGQYSQCRHIQSAPTSGEEGPPVFGGQYCTVTVSSAVTNTSDLDLTVSLGVCLPDSCSEKDVMNLSKNGIKEFSTTATIKSTKCFVKERTPLDASAIVFICLLAILASVIFTATLYDLHLRHQRSAGPLHSEIYTPPVNQNGAIRKRDYIPIGPAQFSQPITNGAKEGKFSVESQADTEESETSPLLSHSTTSTKDLKEESKGSSCLGICSQSLLAFSALTNGTKLLSVGPPKAGTLTPVHGIRFLSMTWVILGHTLFFGLLSPAIGNPTVVSTFAKDFAFQAILNATVSVDTFFLISGTLLTYLLLQEMQKKDGPMSINWPMFYFHRFWRLTPPYMLVVGVSATVYPYLGEGPFWDPWETAQECRTHWWINMLYLNNLLKPFSTCIKWSWYLANDMQFFLISPIFLIPIFLSVKLGLCLVVVGILASVLTTGIISYQGSYPPELAGTISSPAAANLDLRWGKNVYFPPWTRLGPYLIGVLLGYVLYSTQEKTLRISKAWLVLGWGAATLCCMAVLYGMYGVAQGHDLDPGVSALYAALHRPGWALGVAWLIFACCTGYGGFVNTLLSWNILVPLSRLTFMAYLVHPLVIKWYYNTQETLIYFTYSNMAWWFLGHLVMSYGLALVLSLAFEAPMLGLEKLLLGRK